MVIPEPCLACGSTRYKKNGHTRHGKQNHLCKNCEHQFSASASNHLISAERRAEIENLWRERISLRGICRAVGVSLTWLLHFMVECFASCPDHLNLQLPTRPAKVWLYKLEAEADEMWSFVQKKANKQWIWLAMDVGVTTRQMIAFHVGDRSRESAKALWASIPAVYQDHATFHTDQYEVYKGSSRRNATEQSRRKHGKPTTLSASITRCGNAFPALSATSCPSPRRLKIILGPSNSSSATTTWRKREHYLCSTTYRYVR
jgi:insertion element IS1 protein InsB